MRRRKSGLLRKRARKGRRQRKTLMLLSVSKRLWLNGRASLLKMPSELPLLVAQVSLTPAVRRSSKSSSTNLYISPSQTTLLVG
jgi:hypothetical protein